MTGDGEVYDMSEVQVDSTTVSGRRQAEQVRSEIPLEQVGVFEERRFDFIGTVGLGVISYLAFASLYYLTLIASGGW